MDPKAQASEVDKFFEDLPSQDKKVADVFDQPKSDEKPITEEVKDDDEVRKNRRHRRLEEQLNRERESNIQLNERIKILAETTPSQVDNTLDPDLLRVFGTTDEGKEIARIMGDKISSAVQLAEDRAEQRMEMRQIEQQREEREYEKFIDSKLEDLEETHNIDLTSDAPKARKARHEFLEMVESLSPKDENNNITGYADFESTFDVYQKTRERPQDSSRQKEIASKSMQRSSSNDSGKATNDATRDYLRSIGIRDI